MPKLGSLSTKGRPAAKPASSLSAKGNRHDPLHVQLQKDASVELRNAGRSKPAAAAANANGDTGMIVDVKTSRKILDLVRKQQDEIADEKQRRRQARDNDDDDEDALEYGPNGLQFNDEDDDDDNNDQDLTEYEEFEFGVSGLDVDAADQELIEKFMTKEPKKQINLSDLIMSKIQAAKDEADAKEEAEKKAMPPTLNPKVVEVYTKVGILLSRYRAGPLPKPFKIIPTLRDWEEVIYITNPAEWSPQAVYQATRIFASNLKEKMAQRFFNLILLERFRDEINETKKLNYHLFMALKKALYKPGAFFKGILLPLCESGNCTLREAVIVGSVLSKVSVPAIHSAAVLLKIAEMDYTGPNSLFIRVLLDKKYALPFKTVDALVFHFLRFKSDHRQLPVLWHQALLAFVQRYKEDLTTEQKEAVLDLLKHKYHEGISPEIRRELQNSVSRGEAKMDAQEDVEMGVDF
ncbi:Bystin-domain-containing protein [Entophlyctis helioformis]|nr:Bystin-domain-containing protein [Entophlyctis helioformis]